MSDVEQIRQLALVAAREGPLGDRVKDIELEPASDDDDVEFLRVVVTLAGKEPQSDADLEKLLEDIEELAAALDPRYVSVRFQEAA